jgi:holo-[acyl-carrier protein] synthase
MQFASHFGIDGVSISDIQSSIDSFGDSYCDRVYSSLELSLARLHAPRTAATLAAMFAGKEAVVKALDLGDQAFSWRDIEVLPAAGADVLVSLHGELGKLVPADVQASLRVALTRAGDLVLAMAVVQH